jgi:polyphosphate glucokinase
MVKVLIIDVGGSNVKLWLSGDGEPRRFESGLHLTPRKLIEAVREMTSDWSYDVVSLGIPGLVKHHGPSDEPGNLAEGWVDFNFTAAFDRPVRVVNDAAMQALGAYEGGRMLFLGLGTGVGSALIAERVVVTLELGCLPYTPQETLFDRVGTAGLKKHGPEIWEHSIHEAVRVLRRVFTPDYVMLGGGQAELIRQLPEGSRRGGNEDACTGGIRLWEERIEPHDRIPSTAYRVVA